MMKTYLILFVSFFTQLIFAQKIEVQFLFKEKISDFELASYQKKFILKQDEKQSLFELIDLNDLGNFKYPEVVKMVKRTDSITFYNVNGQGFVNLTKEFSYKDFAQNKQWTERSLGYADRIFVADKIDIFNWKLEANDSIVGGFTCQKATTHFRGRDYVAYYTSEIANQGGPWKFDGLPGFILFIKSLDGKVSIEPLKIALEANFSSIINPTSTKESVVYEDLYKLLIKTEKARFAKSKARNPYLQSVKHGLPGTIEIIEELRAERVYE